ncbi:MAG: hypothetical protein LBN27_13185 [Prevotellaceae bacterium]|nr:hypothetical protein [Prevotellaceae bacterium]
MKNTQVKYVMLLLIFFILFSCNKDTEQKEEYSKKEIIGKWEHTGTYFYVNNHLFTEDSDAWLEFDDNGIVTSESKVLGFLPDNYTLFKNKIILNNNNITFEIVKLSKTELNLHTNDIEGGKCTVYLVR